jgi:exopolysaccharide biosynthesis polyprenyl glycosylphosphotransferase
MKLPTKHAVERAPGAGPGVSEPESAERHRKTPPSGSMPQGRILSRHEFIAHYRLERRRANRTQAPLSVAVFSCEPDDQDAKRQVKRLARDLPLYTRETDVLGYLDDEHVALLLPDTDAAGADTVCRNALRRLRDLRCTVRIATYPDEVFDSLTESRDREWDSLPFLVDGSSDRGVLSRLTKRGIDLVGSLALLVITSPLLATVALAIRLTSPGPVIFRQTRVGESCVPFEFLKFRSMYVNSDDSIHRDYVGKLIDGQHDAINQGRAEQPHYKLAADPRVTTVGRWIRATSLDELPQLVNVLRGDMSLVGPRPPLPYEVEKYRAWHLTRILDVKPGITGLWQVEGRSRTSFDDMVRLDIQYIRYWSPWLDIKILLKTVVVVMRRRGAT